MGSFLLSRRWSYKRLDSSVCLYPVVQAHSFSAQLAPEPRAPHIHWCRHPARAVRQQASQVGCGKSVHAKREADLAAMVEVMLQHVPDNPAPLVCIGVALAHTGQRFSVRSSEEKWASADCIARLLSAEKGFALPACFLLGRLDGLLARFPRGESARQRRGAQALFGE